MPALKFFPALVCVSVIATSFALAGLTGCSGGVFPDTSIPAVETGAKVSPPLEGSVYGGHAPLVGAKVYVLTPSLTALNGQSASLMDGDTQNAGLTPTGSGNGAVSAGGTNGYHYVTTDLNGSYSLTGDYACTVDQAVYLVAVGGSPTFPSGSNTFDISNVTVTNPGANSIVTFTTTTTENAYIGEQVTFSGFTGIYAALNTYTATVVATNLTTTTFAYSTTGVGTGSQTYTAPYPTATLIPTGNPAAINMTALGLCPSSGSFAGHLSYIYTNEVSTAAMAVATGAFGSGPFNVGVATGGPVDSYYSSYDKNGLKQALNNAGLLYDITGGEITTSYAGEGHIARAVTPAGNGIIPQALMDTWGNILAACVDSNNTGTGALASPQCATLFSNATSTGIACSVSSGTITCPSGTTAPTDIATAAYNIAHFPAGTATTVGTNPAFVNALYSLPTGNLPFTPNLVSTGAGQPNDFSVAIAFFAPTASGANNNRINGPQTIAINGGNYVGNEAAYTSDAAGELQESVWIADFNTGVVKLFANGGAPDYTTNNALSTAGTVDARSVAIDAAQNVWVALQFGPKYFEFSPTGATVQTYVPAGAAAPAQAQDAAIDGIGTNYNLYVAGYTGNIVTKTAIVNGATPSATNVETLNLQAGNAAFSTATNGTLGSGQATCDTNVVTFAFAPSGTLFQNADSNVTTYATNNSYVCTLNTTTGAQGNTPGTGSGFFYQNVGEGPATIAVDGSGNAWIGGGQTTAGASQGVYKVTAAGVKTAYTGGGTNDPCSVAIDGANNVWVGNAGIYGISEFSNAGVAISPVANTGTYSGAVGGYNPQIKNTLTVGANTYFNPGTTASNCASPAIDRAGDIWMAYQGSGSYAPGVVFEILGIAAPVVTPRSYATFGNGTTGFLGQRPY